MDIVEIISTENEEEEDKHINETSLMIDSAPEGHVVSSNSLIIQSTEVVRKTDPKFHAILSLLMCYFCCNPIGLVAVIQSVKVNDAVHHGDYAKAADHKHNIRPIYMSGICIGTFVYVVAIIAIIVVFVIIPNMFDEGLKVDTYPDE